MSSARLNPMDAAQVDRLVCVQQSRLHHSMSIFSPYLPTILIISHCILLHILAIINTTLQSMHAHTHSRTRRPCPPSSLSTDCVPHLHQYIVTIHSFHPQQPPHYRPLGLLITNIQAGKVDKPTHQRSAVEESFTLRNVSATHTHTHVFVFGTFGAILLVEGSFDVTEFNSQPRCLQL